VSGEDGVKASVLTSAVSTLPRFSDDTSGRDAYTVLMASNTDCIIVLVNP
jgi:hypothetical protein